LLNVDFAAGAASDLLVFLGLHCMTATILLNAGAALLHDRVVDKLGEDLAGLLVRTFERAS
jgi:hypothetical protein